MPAILFLLLSLCGATATAAQGPTTYVWQLTCAGNEQLTFGPYSLPEQCDAMSTTIAETCERPLLGPNRPNPAFLRIADVCQEAHNGWDCVCEYLAVQARPQASVTVLEIVRAAEAKGFLSLGDLFRAREVGVPIDAVVDLFHARRAAAGGPIPVHP